MKQSRMSIISLVITRFFSKVGQKIKKKKKKEKKRKRNLGMNVSSISDCDYSLMHLYVCKSL
jgi:hypothetical protein